MSEQNNPQTINNARKKIAQLKDASERADLIYRYGVGRGWFAALCLEGLVDAATFNELNGELNMAYEEAGSQLPA